MDHKSIRLAKLITIKKTNLALANRRRTSGAIHGSGATKINRKLKAENQT